MKKTPSLFKRDYNGTRLIYDEVVPGSEWVIAGEGIATLKIDGTSCLLRDGKLYRRYELKEGKPQPVGFEAAQDPDPVTGDIPGWILVSEGAADRWHREAWQYELGKSDGKSLPDGTYELMGPKIQGNTFGLDGHQLIPHGGSVLTDVPRSFDALKEYFRTHEIEGASGTARMVAWSKSSGNILALRGP